jgi:iron complex outermembrane recepter protein
MRPLGSLLRALVLGAVLSTAAFGADESKKTYDIPAGEAVAALRQFAAVSGRETLFAADAVRGVRTPALKGQLTVQEAIDTLLAGTGLVATTDAKTGAIAVRRESPAEAKNAPSRPADAPAATGTAVIEQGIIKLQQFEVLGSRIRRTAEEGPSPVGAYDAETIRASGALNLADFLRSLPQAYSGIGVGRGSAPNEFNLDNGRRTENQLPLLSPSGVSPPLAANTPIQSGVSGVSLRSLGSGSTLVLVDGRRVAQSGVGNRNSATGQGFVDLNTIPLGLIERIEVITDGASAIYGADAVAGVINIILKKQWVGSEVSGTAKLTQHGGARERQATLVTGFASQKLRGTLAIDYYDRGALFASQRENSRNLNHTGLRVGNDPTTGAAVFGTDQRIQFGTTSVVQAVPFPTGTITALGGAPVALTPVGAANTPPASAFVPVTTNAPGQANSAIIAQGQRATNFSDYLHLAPASERYGVTGSATYVFSPRVEVYANASHSDSRSFAQTMPAYVATPTAGAFVIGAAPAATVPAAYNPFGQDVAIGMVLEGFGTIKQRTKTLSDSVTAGARGQVGRSWRWDAGYRWQQQSLAQVTRSFNLNTFLALLSNPDASGRFNPFIADPQAAILERAAVYPTVDADSRLETVDFSADGEVVEIWGGPVRAAFGGALARERSKNTAVNYSTAAVPVATTVVFEDNRRNEAAFGELSVPLFGKKNARTLLRRLELNLAGRHEDYSDAGHAFVPKIGATWAPFGSLLLRGSYAEGFRPPSITEDRVLTTNNNAFAQDPLRGNAPTIFTLTFVTNPGLRPETSKTRFGGIVWEPSFAKGLSFQANYYETIQEDAIQLLGVPSYILNQALFPGTVIRNEPTAADIAAGRPGSLRQVFVRAENFGRVTNESMDFVAEYRLPWEQLGRWRVSVNAAHLLAASRELTPGAVAIEDEGDTFAGPDWNYTVSVYWNHGPWSANVHGTYLSGFAKNSAGVRPTTLPIPSVSKMDLRVGYEFKNGIGRNWAKGLRLQAGVANVFDKKPPFVDTIYGFNPGLHSQYILGRTFEFSFVLPLR